MMIAPERIKFETGDDVIDYVTRGLFAPRREDFNKVMHKVRFQDDPEIASSKMGSEPVIIKGTIQEQEIEAYIRILNRVEENRLRRQKKALIMTAWGVGLLIGISAITGGVAVKPARRKEVYYDDDGKIIKVVF